MQIDATFYRLAPGKLRISPERVVKVPDMFEKAGWDILVCPEPEMPESHPMYNCPSPTASGPDATVHYAVAK